jgi:hypothetical protein
MLTLKDWNSIFNNRQTTMPAIGEGNGDPRRTASGPPAEPLRRHLAFYQDQKGLEELCLIHEVDDKQRKEDAAQWFKEGNEYVQRTSVMIRGRPDLFSHIPWKADDLEARLGRLNWLRAVIASGRRCLDALETTLLVEEADLMHMCDFAVEEAQVLGNRPSTSASTRANLLSVTEIPLELWQKRSQEIRDTKAANESLRARLDEAFDRIGELESEKQETPALFAAPARTPAPEKRPLPATAKRRTRR